MIPRSGPRSPSPDVVRGPEERIRMIGEPGQRIRVVLVDDHHLVREGLRLMLTVHGVEVVGESPNVAGAFELIDRHHPDVMLLDLTLGEDDGVALLRELHARSPETAILVVTMHRDPETVRQALLAGAAGYVIKGAHTEGLLDAIEAVMRGERYLHSSVTGVIVDNSLRWLQSGGRVSAREREILVLLASELSVAEIGTRLGISPYTVRRHIANLCDKLELRGIPALIRYAVKEGLVRPSEGG